jgi:hypothetical protein
VLRLRDTFARFEALFVARDALFVVLRLRDAFARFEAVFLARGTLFAAVRPRALPPPTLARDLDAVIADLLLRVAAVLEAVFFEASVFLFLGSDVFLAGRPRALLPPPDLEAVVFDDLAIHNSFELDWDLPAPGARQQSNRKRGQRREFPWEPRNNLEALCESSPSRSPSTGRATCGEPIDEIADRERCTKRHVADTLPLAFLAPGLVRAVIEARLPRGISTRSIAEPELEWSRQWTTLGIRTRPASLARLSQT